MGKYLLNGFHSNKCHLDKKSWRHFFNVISSHREQFAFFQCFQSWDNQQNPPLFKSVACNIKVLRS
jgi:hypothetical protein